MTTNIYILKLEKNKYYVGKSDNLEQRKNAHLNGTACFWTKKYKPISIEKIIPNASPFDEDKYTIEYMSKYGIDNVRGGIYITETLDEIQKYNIQKSIWGATNCCTQCGRLGHFVKNCTALKNIYGEDIYEEFSNEESSNGEEILIYCCDFCNKEFNSLQGVTCHENLHCRYKNNSINQNCYRCGREGHYSNNCYAKTDINYNRLD